MPVRSIPSLLSLPELITAMNTGAEIEGSGVEAEADRHLLDKRYREAADVYSTLDLDDLNRREKLAYCLYCVEEKGFFGVLDPVIERASPWGLALHLWGYDATRYSSGPTREERATLLASVLESAIKMDAWPVLRVYLIAGCWYHSLQLDLAAPDMRALQARASSALAECGAKHQESMELCTRIFNFYHDRSAPQKQALSDLVATVSAENTAVLSALYQAARIVENTPQAMAALHQLVQRFKDDPALESTVTAAAVVAGNLDFLECLPEELKAISRGRAEVQLLEAIAAGNQELVVEIASAMPAHGPSDSVLYQPCIAEPVFSFLLGRTDHTGGWGDSAPWGYVMGARVFKALPPGALRNSFLREFRDFLGEDELHSRARELCDLFESTLEDDDFNWILTPECLCQVSPDSFARYLVMEAAAGSEYCPFESAEDIPWQRFAQPIKDALAMLPAETRQASEVLLEEWGVQWRPSLADRLAGGGLPEAVSSPLAQIDAAISSLGGSDLAYLQLAMMKLSARIAERISPAAGREVSIQAYNDFVHPSRLTEYGEERVRKLATRYGAAGFLQGLDALIASPEFNPKTDRELPALSKMLVKLQGGLAGRRAYLAGILRKRLKNLKSTWLDQQVSECMARGVDIEQMIDLAKTVNSWDDWSDGLADLRPY